MNFAPYQDDSPETTRALSPSPRPTSPRIPTSPSRRTQHDPWGYGGGGGARPHSPSYDPEAQQYARGDTSIDARIGELPSRPTQQSAAFGNGLGADERNMDVYSTSLPLRLDVEACLAYVLLPPAGAALLLILEHKSDYVRFHAWQSGLLFTFIFLFHLIFSFLPRAFFYIFLVCDITLILFLTLKAYKDAETLDRYEVPFFGKLASSFVDEE